MPPSTDKMTPNFRPPEPDPHIRFRGYVYIDQSVLLYFNLFKMVSSEKKEVAHMITYIILLVVFYIPLAVFIELLKKFK